jgi:hypothetical protein
MLRYVYYVFLINAESMEIYEFSVSVLNLSLLKTHLYDYQRRVQKCREDF